MSEPNRTVAFATRVRRGLLPAAVFLVALNLVVLGSSMRVGTAAQAGSQKPTTDAPRELRPGQQTEREMTGAQTHRYQLSLQKDEFFQVRVEQKGLDVLLKLLDASGNVLATMDSPNGKQGPETLSFIAAQPGAYTLEVSGFDEKAERGVYTIRRVEARAANAQDRRRVEVERLFVAGVTALNTKGQTETVIEKLTAAQAGWRELADDYAAELTARTVKQLKANVALDKANGLFKEGTAQSYRAALEKFEEARGLYQETDQQGAEATALNSIGLIHSNLGEKREALGYFNQALPLCRAAGDKGREAQTLNHIGMAYIDLGEKQEALTYFNEALPLYRAVGDKGGEASALNNIGIVYDDLGEKQEALSYLNQALPLYRATGNKVGEATALNNIGRTYDDLGEKQEALNYLNQALALFRAVGNKSAEAMALSNIGSVYSDLGERQKALSYYDQALPPLRATGDKVGEATTLNNIGKAYDDLGDKQKALEYYGQVLPLLRAAGDKMHEALALNNIGKVYDDLGDRQKARDYFNQALPLHRAVGNKSGEATTLNNIGMSYSVLGDKQKALDYFGQALPLFRAAGYRSAEAVTLSNIMYAWKSLGNRRLAVFYGKQSVNKYQELRQAIKGLEKETQKNYLNTVDTNYRTLADILISEGRLPEAEQVLALLKEEEYSGLLRRRDDAPSDIGYSPAEGEAVKVLAQLAELGRERGELAARLDRKELDEAGRARLNMIERELLPKANAEFTRALDAIGREAPETAVKTAEVRDAQALMGQLRKLGPGTVALYTIISTEAGRAKKGWVMLVAPEGNIRKAYEMDVGGLEQTVLELRSSLRTPSADPRPAARKLYRMIFQTPQPKGGPTLEADLETYLKNQRDRTLMWSLDGVLRYVPMSALSPDGEHYLVERYRNVVFTPASIPGLTQPVSREWTALGLGVSRAYRLTDDATKETMTFGELKGVPLELAAIVRGPGNGGAGVLPGVAKLNEQFDREAMLDGLREGFSVVHIASHFHYQPANPNRSFLLLGDGGRLEMSAFNDAPQIFEKTELLTLSACDTAVGSGRDENGKDAEGLGFVAQKLGAQAVIASLWPVDDISTQVLMPEFYRLRQTGLSKAESLRQAQLSLLRGASRGASSGTRAELAGEATTTAGLMTYKPDPQHPYAHPYYWAPFILIGNWK